MGAFEKVTEENISWFPDLKLRDVDFVFFLKEKTR